MTESQVRQSFSTATGRAVLDWEGGATGDALALRLAGALHGLARSGYAGTSNTLPAHSPNRWQPRRKYRANR